MGLAFHLIGFAVNQVAGAGGQAVTGLLQAWMDDPAGRLPKAIDSAHQDAWRVLELALQQRGGLANRVVHLPRRLFNSEEKRALADHLAGFLADEPLVLSDPATADQALAELRRVRGPGRRGMWRAGHGAAHPASAAAAIESPVLNDPQTACAFF